MRAFRWFRKIRKKMINMDEGREYVGVDKFGNKYFQYYSQYGLPTRREIHAVDTERLSMFEDTAFFWWLRKQKDLPPSEFELKSYYQEENERMEKAITQNRESRKLDNEYYEKRRLEDQLWDSQQTLTDDEFEPEKWEPRSNKIPEKKSRKWGLE